MRGVRATYNRTMAFPKIVLDLVVTDACNRRCRYCCVDKRNRTMPDAVLDAAADFVTGNLAKAEGWTVNFFGGEPLLNMGAIRRFLDKVGPREGLSYLVATNGMLMDADKAAFFRERGVSPVVSVHSDGRWKELFALPGVRAVAQDAEANFIVAPDDLEGSAARMEATLAMGFRKVNVIPVMLTMKWGLPQIGELAKFVDASRASAAAAGVPLEAFSYFDGFPPEAQLVVDCDGGIYQDLSDELYIAKQYDGLPAGLADRIEKATLLARVQEAPALEAVMARYDIKELIRLSYDIPKAQGWVQDYALIARAMHRGTARAQNTKRFVP